MSSQDGPTGPTRTRRNAAESGAFGKSTRRSKSRTATPARREDPTIQSADTVFKAWFKGQNSQANDTNTPPNRRNSQTLITQPMDDNITTAAPARNAPKEPVEVILRGFKSSEQQYASINHYEQLAGRICEDYPRDPPVENRRYKSELRDPAFTRRRPLTPEERAKVNHVDGGEHWVKITFESAQAADAAVFASPQVILGHMIFAEPYHGLPPSRDEPVPDATTAALGDEVPQGWRRAGMGGNRTAAELRQSFGTRLPHEVVADDMDVEMSPPNSQASSRTMQSATLDSLGTSSSSTVTGQPAASQLAAPSNPDGDYCRMITSARKIKLLPVEQALLPQPSYTQRVLSRIPFLKWFSGSMIGNEVPRTDTGDFDFDKASLYWKMIYWLDSAFGLFGGEILSADKED